MEDALGDRMKDQYESRTRYKLPRRTFTIIRVDGKAFHTFTKGLRKPFDQQLIECMDGTAKELCRKIQGAQFAYVQSDEISILLTDFEKHTTDAWFDGNLQKMASISASIATSAFNIQFLQAKFQWETQDPITKKWVPSMIEKDVVEEGVRVDYGDILNYLYLHGRDFANFDSRVFTIPDQVEVANYFIWRQQDAMRNSVQSCARSMFSHKELEGKNIEEMKAMMLDRGFDWNAIDETLKCGRFVQKRLYHGPKGNPNLDGQSFWYADPCPMFSKDPLFLADRIPELPRFEAVTE